MSGECIIWPEKFYIKDDHAKTVTLIQCRENDAKNSEEEVLAPVMGSIQQAMEFEDTDLGRKMMAKAPKDGATAELEGESDFGDWELIADAPATPNLSEGSAYENVSEVDRTIEVSFNKEEEGEERDNQGKFKISTFS